MTTFEVWPDLHDGVITSILIEWPGPTAAINLKTGEYNNLRIAASNTTLFQCPQLWPWGKSPELFVNWIRLTRSESSANRLEIETQGGDVVVIEAGEIAIMIPD